MPCDSVRETKVDLGNVNPDLLRAALAGLGVTDYRFANGIVTLPGYRSLAVNDIKKAYSKTVLTTQAKRFGWHVKEEKNGKLTLQKASIGKRL